MDEYEPTDEDKRVFVKKHVAEHGPKKPFLSQFPSNAKGRKQFKAAQEKYETEREETEAEALQLFTDELNAFSTRRNDYHHSRLGFCGRFMSNPAFADSKLLQNCSHLREVAQLFDDRQYEWKTTLQRCKDGSYHLKVKPVPGIGLAISGFTQDHAPVVDFREPMMAGPAPSGSTRPRQHRIRNFTAGWLAEHRHLQPFDILVQINHYDVRQDAFDNGDQPGWTKQCLTRCKHLFTGNRMLSVLVTRMNVFPPWHGRKPAWLGYCTMLPPAAELRYLVGELLLMEALTLKWYTKHSKFAVEYMEELAERLQAVKGECDHRDCKFSPGYVEHFAAKRRERGEAGAPSGKAKGAPGSASDSASASSGSSSSAQAASSGAGSAAADSDSDDSDTEYPEIKKDPTIEYDENELPRMCIPSDSPMQALRQELERLRKGILTNSGTSLVPELLSIGKDVNADFKIEEDGLEIMNDDEVAAAAKAKQEALQEEMVDLALSSDEDEERASSSRAKAKRKRPPAASTATAAKPKPKPKPKQKPNSKKPKELAKKKSPSPGRKQAIPSSQRSSSALASRPPQSHVPASASAAGSLPRASHTGATGRLQSETFKSLLRPASTGSGELRSGDSSSAKAKASTSGTAATSTKSTFGAGTVFGGSAQDGDSEDEDKDVDEDDEDVDVDAADGSSHGAALVRPPSLPVSSSSQGRSWYSTNDAGSSTSTSSASQAPAVGAKRPRSQDGSSGGAGSTSPTQPPSKKRLGDDGFRPRPIAGSLSPAASQSAASVASDGRSSTVASGRQQSELDVEQALLMAASIEKEAEALDKS